MKFYSGLILFLVLLTGCEKNIDIKLEDTTPKLVVEATIETGEYPMAVLTKSVGYFSRIDPQALLSSFVRNADVFVSNGTSTHKLKEYAVAAAPGVFLYYYTVDSSNLATAFKGALNQSYSLRIVAEGREYTANTTIKPLRKTIDSMYARQAPQPDTSKRNILIKVTDPVGFGDYIRVFTKLNSSPFLPPFNSAFDDLFIDGTTYEVQMVKGYDRNDRGNAGNSDRSLFNKGDTVTLKMSSIDKATYEFWQTMEYSYGSIGNPFSTPTKVTSNISNGALGYFGGYASVYKTLIVPR
jgi:hypothetical protein